MRTLPSGLSCANTARLSPTHAVVMRTLPLRASACRWQVTAVVPDWEQSRATVHAWSCSTKAAVVALCRLGWLCSASRSSPEYWALH